MTAPTARTDEATRPEMSSGGSRVLNVTFVFAAGLGSALIFLVEPLAVRMLLPLLGGSPAVWNTAMVFFQLALLLGYLVAHGARLRLPWASRPWLQIGFVALGLLALPVAVPTGWTAPASGQALWILAVLVVMIGLPFVALSTLGPTLQGWMAETAHPRADEPYFLYAAGNTGSVIGLLGYPLIVEPMFGLTTQALLWALGYVSLICVLLGAAYLRRRHPAAVKDVETSHVAVDRTPIAMRLRLRWVVLASVPSGLLLAVTQHISTDIASIPLLWVVPLTIYLGTFVVAFARPVDRCPPAVARIALIGILPIALTLPIGLWSAEMLVVGIVMHLTVFALVAVAVHFQLSASRPHPDRLTEFYIWIAVGGLFGGLGVALAAPVIFSAIVEYPLLLLGSIAILWRPAAADTPATRRIDIGALAFVAVLGVVATVAGVPVSTMGAVVLGFGAAIWILGLRIRLFAIVLASVLVLISATALWPNEYQTRSFFGVLSVSTDNGVRTLTHGSTTHGSQIVHPAPSLDPTLYYQSDGGVGRVLNVTTDQRVAVVGLGAGTLAAYAPQHREMVFYEIDQAVVDVAADPAQFTYVSSAGPLVTIETVDGRIGVSTSGRTFDLVILDAFSSDAIPVHLLTEEAITAYRDRIADGGIILVHITNRYFDLGPVLSRTAEEVGLEAWEYSTPISRWVALGSGDAVRPELAIELMSWNQIRPDPSVSVWTDDHANVLAAFILR